METKSKQPLKRIKDPIPYEKIQCVYEGLSETVFITQITNMMRDLSKEMSDIVKKQDDDI